MDILPAIIPQSIRRITPEPTTQKHSYVYTIDYWQQRARGLRGDFTMPPKDYKAIWGWVSGLRDGLHTSEDFNKHG